MGIRRRWLAGGERDGAWDAVVSLGRPGPHVESDRDLYPARHLWMAWSTGTYEPARGTVGVKLAGWHPASDPLRARILSDSANEAASSVRCPQTGELGVVGFENGNPDAPVWLGAVHDREAPAGAAADRFLWMLNLADGGTVSVGVADGALEIRLAKLKLKVETDAALSLQAEELDVQAKGKMTGRGETLGFEADSAVMLKGKDVSIAASKVGVEKG
jgi:phage baseplate assembly protein gpV